MPVVGSFASMIPVASNPTSGPMSLLRRMGEEEDGRGGWERRRDGRGGGMGEEEGWEKRRDGKIRREEDGRGGLK